MELRKLKDKASEAFTKGRFSKAAELYEEYCRADPKDHQSRLRTGDAWAKAGQRERAVSAYQSAAEGFAKEGFLPRAIAASKLILELDPAHRGVQQMLADLYARRAAPVGARAHGLMGSALTEAPAPFSKPRLPEAIRAAVAEIDLDLEVDASEATRPVAAGGAPVDLSSELPAELSVDAAGAPAGSEEEVLHSVSVGLAYLVPEEGEPARSQDGAAATEDDEPILMGEAVEEAEAEPVVVGEGLPEETDSETAMATSTPLPSVTVSAPVASQETTRAGSTSLPPGLVPRASQRMAVPAALQSKPAPSHTPVAEAQPPVRTPSGLQSQPAPSHTPMAEALPPVRTPSGKWKALSSPIADSTAAAPVSAATPAPNEPGASTAPPGLRPRRAEPQAPAGATALAFRELSPALGASPGASAGASSFTELELEGDSLLHAVELAAQSGLSQRASMSVSPVADDEEIYSLTEEVSADGRSLNELPTIPLFSDLPRDAFIELFERCPLRRFGPGERIIEQGTHGDAFYVICEGAVRVFRMEGGQRQDLATLEGGACFGEMALLSGAARTASVEGASEDAQLLEISAPVLTELSRRYPLVAKALKKFCRQRLLTNVMNTSPLFRPFNRQDRRTLVERFRARDVERDDVIIRDGDQTDGLYVVLSGEVSVSKDGHLLTRLKEGDLFGEISLLQKTPATATVMATRHTTLLRLPRADFDMLISSHPQILVLISELSDERLQRTQRVLGEAADMGGAPAEGDEDLILV